jgi:hypothetical protein
VFIHTILEFFDYSYIEHLTPFIQPIRILYGISLPIATFSRAFLAYQWNNAIFRKNAKNEI